MKAAVVAVVVAAVALVGLGTGVVLHRGEEARAEPWTRGPSLSSRRSYIAAAQVEESIFVAGGMVGESGRPLATFQRFDARERRWTTLGPLPVATRAAAGAALGGRIYVVGGQTRRGAVADAWSYDIDRASWSRRAPLPVPRFNHAAVALGGRLYVLGGFEGTREHADVFAYTPATDSWERVGPLPRPMHAFGALAYRGELWVIGGIRGERVLREVWIFDPRTRRWRVGPTMPKPMELLGTAAVGDEIHALWESTYQILDTRTNRWRAGPTPTVTRHALQLFHADGSLWAIGGCTTALRDTALVETREL